MSSTTPTGKGGNKKHDRRKPVFDLSISAEPVQTASGKRKRRQRKQRSKDR